MPYKPSGLLTEAGRGASDEALRPYVEHLNTSFGAQRLMWGSDWPVLLLAGDYLGWFDMVERLLSELSEDERRCVFGETARLFYRIDV